MMQERLSRWASAWALMVVHVDVARFVAFDGDHLETGHGGGSGVRAVGGGGDEADVPVAFSRMLLVAADSQKPRIFPCRARVGLEGNGGKAVIFARRSAGWRAFPGCLRLVAGTKGCRELVSGHVMGIISEAALSFIVQEPSGIMASLRARSRDSRRRM